MSYSHFCKLKYLIKIKIKNIKLLQLWHNFKVKIVLYVAHMYEKENMLKCPINLPPKRNCKHCNAYNNMPYSCILRVKTLNKKLISQIRILFFLSGNKNVIKDKSNKTKS